MTTELESQSAAAPNASEDRHSRKCTICNHPEREAIDEAFLHWSRGERIVRDYNLPSLSSLYRHAHACGLWNLRRIKIRCALDRLIELAGDCKPSGNAVLRAIEMSCNFDENDRYVAPNKRVIVEHRIVNQEPVSNRKSDQPAPNVTPTKQSKQTKPGVRADDSARRNIDPNRESLRLETDVTPTKQRPDHDSNRELEALLAAPAKTAMTAAIQDMLLGRS
jgi:hypothetical protein